jgi:Flp pilus assembly protein TadD
MAAGWAERGHALRDLGRHRDALDAYDRALALDPQQPEVWHGKGITLRGLGRHAEAATAYAQAEALRLR